MCGAKFHLSERKCPGSTMRGTANSSAHSISVEITSNLIDEMLIFVQKLIA